MNEHSYICCFIRENPDDWAEKIHDKKINMHPRETLTAFNYATVLGPDFTDPVVQEARGIIIDTEKCEVACWPFRKFGNWNESYADSIDWKTARVQEKIDGSLIKLYFYHNEWVWATNSTVRAEEAKLHGSNRSFLDVIHSAVNYRDIDFSSLNRDYTYIFELVSPETRVVIAYPNAKLYHTGTRNNITGEELAEDIGVEKPKEYSGRMDIEFWKNAAEHRIQTSENPIYEGYVVVDRDYHRVKIKTPEYLTAHRLAANWVLTKERAYEILVGNDAETLNIMNTNPRNKMILSYYRWRLDELEYEISMFIAYARGIYEEVNHDKKALAEAIKTHRLSWFGFSAIGNERTAKEMVSDLMKNRRSTILRLITGYEDFSKEN